MLLKMKIMLVLHVCATLQLELPTCRTGFSIAALISAVPNRIVLHTGWTDSLSVQPVYNAILVGTAE